MHNATKRGGRLLGRSTALSCAASWGHTPVVEQLIAAGAGLDVQTSKGYGRCSEWIGFVL